MPDNKKELLEQLKAMVKEQINEAIAPLKESASDWKKDIYGADKAENKAVPAARIVCALAACRGDIEKAARFAKRAWNDDMGKALSQVFEKALDAGVPTSGGFMIPEDMSREIIDLLRPRSVVRAAGAPTVPMPRGTLTLPKQTGDVSASYVGESTDITSSTPSGDQIILSAKKLAALVPVSNDLLSYDVGDSADRFVRDSLVRRIAVREDAAFLRDDGTSNTPTGLRYQAASGNVIASGASGATDAAGIEADLIAAINALESSNVDMTGPAWFISPRTKNNLMKLRDASGNLVYPELRSANPTIYTFPVYVTTNIPTNLGTGTNESEIYLANMPDTLIAESGGLEITADTSAAYIEGGTLVSSFSRDQTVVRAIVRHDFTVLYPESVAVLTGVLY